MTTAAAALEFAHHLADAADALTLGAFRSAMAVRSKVDGTFVTAIDEAVEAHVRARIAEEFPEHGFLGEESGGTTSEAAPTWVVDPIDGTNNFISGNPVFATLIALQVDGHEVAAVVSAPALGSRWDALIEPGQRRATQDGTSIHVSDRSLAQGQVSFGGLDYFEQAGQYDLVRRLTTATRRQRGFGDFWQHCLVAAGSVEVAVEAAVAPWDLAAVKCLVEAAGGRFTDLAGQRTITGGSAVSSNAAVHDEVLAMVGTPAP